MENFGVFQILTKINLNFFLKKALKQPYKCNQDKVEVM